MCLLCSPHLDLRKCLKSITMEASLPTKARRALVVYPQWKLECSMEKMRTDFIIAVTRADFIPGWTPRQVLELRAQCTKLSLA